MQELLKSTRRVLSVGLFWPLLLLALPNCALNVGGLPNPNDVEVGLEPRSSAVVCDIPKVPDTPTFPCATATDIGIGLASTRGAVALNSGDNNTVKLDYSPESDAQCGAGNPRRIDLFDPFPNGTVICLNCGQVMPEPYPNPTAVCAAKCKELLTTFGTTPAGGADAFCAANATVSTNFDKNVCIEGLCSTSGIPLSPLPDPRLKAADLTWIEADPLSTVTGGTLTFNGPDNNGNFLGGAASDEIINAGDAFVEFEAGELKKTHVIGVRTGCDKAANCPDSDTGLNFPLSISLNVTGEVNIVENGAVVFTAADYQLKERFRINVIDRHDGTADITYTRHTGTCTPGTLCNETLIYARPVATGPSFPLRVDATFREAPASLKDVTIMRIIKK